MNKYLLITIFLVSGFPSLFSNTIIEARITKHPDKFIRAEYDDFLKTSLFEGEKNILMTHPTIKPSVGAEDNLIIRLFDENKNPIPYHDSNINTISFSIINDISENTGVEVILSSRVSETIYKDLDYFQVSFKKDLPDFVKAPHGSLLRIECINSDGTIEKTFFLRRFDIFLEYSYDPFDTRTIGFWVPYGLFGTNFEASESGIQFATAPIGIAVGTKIYVNDKLYLGISGLGSWAITENSNSGSNLDVKSIGVGGLVDFGSILYLGGMYSFDLTSNHNHPGPYFLIGIGSGLLNVLSVGK